MSEKLSTTTSESRPDAEAAESKELPTYTYFHGEKWTVDGLDAESQTVEIVRETEDGEEERQTVSFDEISADKDASIEKAEAKQERVVAEEAAQVESDRQKWAAIVAASESVEGNKLADSVARRDAVKKALQEQGVSVKFGSTVDLEEAVWQAKRNLKELGAKNADTDAKKPEKPQQGPEVSESTEMNPEEEAAMREFIELVPVLKESGSLNPEVRDRLIKIAEKMPKRQAGQDTKKGEPALSTPEAKDKGETTPDTPEQKRSEYDVDDSEHIDGLYGLAEHIKQLKLELNSAMAESESLNDRKDEAAFEVLSSVESKIESINEKLSSEQENLLRLMIEFKERSQFTDRKKERIEKQVFDLTELDDERAERLKRGGRIRRMLGRASALLAWTRENWDKPVSSIAQLREDLARGEVDATDSDGTEKSADDHKSRGWLERWRARRANREAADDEERDKRNNKKALVGLGVVGVGAALAVGTAAYLASSGDEEASKQASGKIERVQNEEDEAETDSEGSTDTSDGSSDPTSPNNIPGEGDGVEYLDFELGTDGLVGPVPQEEVGPSATLDGYGGGVEQDIRDSHVGGGWSDTLKKMGTASSSREVIMEIAGPRLVAEGFAYEENGEYYIKNAGEMEQRALDILIESAEEANEPINARGMHSRYN